MTNKQQNDKQFKISPLILVGGVVLISVFPAAIPIGIVVFVIYKLLKNKNIVEKRKRTPLSSAQKSEYKEQPPRPRPPQAAPPRPQSTAQPRPHSTVQPNPVKPQTQSPNFNNDRNRFVRVTTDYGARHRENVKRLLDAGLMERDEYNMQMARSRSL